MGDIQTHTIEVGKLTRDLKHSEDPTIILLFLMEELGEVARAYLKEGGHKAGNDRVTETFRQEMGDVFYLLLRLAAVTGTDLEEELGKTINKLEKTATP
jgi:NTP pyrophosphatase (non-canonical NTP hydrolase)